MKLKKQALSFITVVALLISLFSVASFVTAGAGTSNLVTNGTFEDGIAGWTSVHGTTGTTSTTANNTTVHQASTAKAHSGSKSLEATLKQAKNELYTEVTGLTPGKTYRFSAWVSGGNDVGFNTELYVLEGAGKAPRDLASLVDGYYRGTSTKATLDAVTLVACATGAIDYWTEVVYDFVPTQSSVTIVYNNNSDRVSYLDDVSIVEKQDTENLVVNGTFDTNIDHWSTYAYKYDAATDRYYNPNTTDGREYKFENGKLVNSKYSTPALMQMVPVVSGKTYVLTAVMQATTTQPGVYVANHEEGQSIRAWADNLKNSTYKHISTTNNSGTVQPVEIEFVATSNVVMVGFNNTGGAWANVDNVSIVEKQAPPVEVALTGSVTKDSVTMNSVTVTWPAAGGVAPKEEITYSVYMSENAITLANIGSATLVGTVNGADELKATATGLQEGTNYYFAVKAADTTPDNEAAETVTIFSEAIRTITTDPVELLQNGGFENVQIITDANDVGNGAGFAIGPEPTGLWIMGAARSTELPIDDFSAACRKLTTTDTHSGNYALSFRFNATLFHAASQKFKMMEGYKYTFTFWYKGMAGAKAVIARDWARFQSGEHYASATIEATDEWTKYTIVYSPSADGDAMIWLTGPEVPDGSECIFDDVSVVEEYVPLYFKENTTAVNSISKDSVNISWNAPTVRDGVAAVTGYKVYISEKIITPDNLSSLTPVATVTDLSYTYTGLKANTGYYFAVEATNGTSSAYLFNTQTTYTQKDQAAPAAGTNLIIDGGFDVSEEFSDNPRDGWHRVNGVGDVALLWGSVYTDVGDSNKMGSVRVYPWQTQLVQWVQVKPNTTYAYSFNAECYLPDGGPAFRVYARDNGVWNGKVLAETKLTTDSTIDTSYQGTFTTGPDTTEVYINPHNAYVSEGTGGQCYFDEIYLVEVEDTSLYMLGGMTLVESGEDYLIISWPEAQADEEASKLTYKVFASDEPITADNIGELTAIASVAGDDQYREVELGDLGPGTRHYFAVSVTNSSGKVAYLFSDSAFTTEGEPEEEEDEDYNNDDDSNGGSDDDFGYTEDNEDISDTGESGVVMYVVLLCALCAVVTMVCTKRKAKN